MFTEHAFPCNSHGRAMATKGQAQYEYHFVKTYGWYENDRTLFIAMEYLDLGDLQSHLTKSGPFKEADTQFISNQILRGLEYMHERGFVHRDLKPSNLLIKQMPPGRPWWVKISDFGLSKNIQQSRALPSNVCGTLGFLAPELLGFNTPGDQLSQLEKWKAADIWAFGETVYRLLTGVSSFGDSIQDLGQYVRYKTEFPREALWKSKISPGGIDFLRHCMAPCPIDRPSATAAVGLSRWPTSYRDNIFGNMTAKTTHKLSCRGKQPPFILFTPEQYHLIVVESRRVIVWDMKLNAVVGDFVGQDNPQFCHASIHPDGRYLCVTQTKRRDPLIFEDAFGLKYPFNIDDGLDGAGSHPTISAFSPDGKTLVTARNDVLCQINIDNNWIDKDRYGVSTNHNTDRDKSENRIKELRFTEDGSELIAACTTQVVIMDTTTDIWFKKHVIEYPGQASGLDISPCGTAVACGSSTGDLWLWTSDTDCWAKLMVSSGGTVAASDALENVRFSARGDSILYNHRGHCGVSMCVSGPLDEIGFSNGLRNYAGQQLGHSPTDSGRRIGATALGGDGSASVVFWKYEFNL